MAVLPGIGLSAVVDSKKEEQAASCEEDKPDVVDFLDQFPFGLPIALMLGIESRWEIANKEDNEKETVPGAHVPVCPSPSDLLVLQESIRGKRPKVSDYGAEVEDANGVDSPLVGNYFLDTRICLCNQLAERYSRQRTSLPFPGIRSRYRK